MFACNRPSSIITRVSAVALVAGALLLLAQSEVLWGAKPPPSVNRPISYLTASSTFNIALVDVGGSSSVTVKRSASDSYPRWSPDGLFIGGYYGLESPETIMVMTASGASETSILTQGEFLNWNLSRPGVIDSTGLDFFSSNCWLGTDAIIFTASTTYDASFFGAGGETITAGRLFIVDTNGVMTPLTESAPHTGYDRDPHWSAALDKVVFATAGASTDELYAINPDGSGLQQITAFAGSVDQLRWPTWSPAGDRIVVAVHPAGPGSYWQLWILDVDLSQPNPVTALKKFKTIDGGGGYVQTAAWSPDGQRIVLSRTVYDSHNRRFFELVIANAVSGAETIVKRTSSNIELPDWNPVP